MANKKSINMARGLGFMAGILSQHQAEPLCSKCRALVKTAGMAGEALGEFEKSGGAASLPAEYVSLYEKAKGQIRALQLPQEPVPQRKLGNCVLPEGKCFLKYAGGLFKQILEG